MGYVVWFENCKKEDIPIVGGKCANLGELTRMGIRVPQGFAVTVDAYRDVVEGGGISDRLKSSLADVPADNSHLLDEVSEEIRKLFETVEVPGTIEEAIDQYYNLLKERYGLLDVPVAVRSSATAEDLPDASFAGQQETYLWVRGSEDVRKYVKKCWSSLFTPRAISYRIKKGFSHDKVYVSVGVQKMVNSRVAGVMFTVNPMNGDRSKIVISGSWGLGELVVSGEVTPDEWIMDKFTGELAREKIGSKHIEQVVDAESGRLVTLAVSSDRQTIPCLSKDELGELVKLGRAIENHYGSPVDIEWAIDRDMPFPDNVFIVQARPETVWTGKDRETSVKKEMSASDFILNFLEQGKKAGLSS